MWDFPIRRLTFFLMSFLFNCRRKSTRSATAQTRAFRGGGGGPYFHHQHVRNHVVQQGGQQPVFVVLQALAVVLAQGQVSVGKGEGHCKKRFSGRKASWAIGGDRRGHLSIISWGPWSMPIPSRSSITASRKASSQNCSWSHSVERSLPEDRDPRSSGVGTGPGDATPLPDELGFEGKSGRSGAKFAPSRRGGTRKPDGSLRGKRRRAPAQKESKKREISPT